MNGIDPAKKIALICVESSYHAVASAGDKHNTLARINSSEPTAKILPIHQFNLWGIHKQRSNVSVTAIALAASGKTNPLRWCRELQVRLDRSAA